MVLIIPGLIEHAGSANEQDAIATMANSIQEKDKQDKKRKQDEVKTLPFDSLPLDQVLSLIHSSEKIAVGDCLCRSDLQNCDFPRRVCLGLNMTAIKTVDAGKTEFISKSEAEKIVLDTHQKGLLHLALYHPDEDETNIEGICGCCPCCCSALHGLLRMNMQDLLKLSPYLSIHDPKKCTNCGECTSHCYFQARASSKGGDLI